MLGRTAPATQSARGAPSAPTAGRITRLEITSTQSPAFGGAAFGSVGQYEQVDGTAYGEVDPTHPRNAIIQDLALAPRNARGMVEYSMGISILKPIDMSRGNHTLLYDVVNRGNKVIIGSPVAPGLNVGGSATEAGDGFLESEGYTLAWSGWQGDITTGLRITLPVARRRNGAEITGRVRSEYVLTAPASTRDLTGPPAYEAASTDNAGATLSRRVHQTDPREPIPNDRWAFADCTATPFPGVPNPTKLCLAGGFDTDHTYELIYTAKNPTVAGLGFAATRDFIAFLRGRNGDRDQHGRRGRGRRGPAASVPTPANPLDGTIDVALMYGASLSGRGIRSFLDVGFNEDAHGRRLVDGAMPHLAANRGAFNVRFAQPTRLSGTQHTEAQFPGAESPTTWGVSHDPIAGVTAGGPDRCRRTRTCPRIIQTVSDTEFWQSVMSLNITNVEGTRDLRLPAEVRLLHFAGTQHMAGSPLAQPPAVLPAAPVQCQLRANSHPFLWHQRALLVALREWVVNGVEPPASRYPTLRAGTLVPPTAVQVPYIAAVNVTLPGLVGTKVFLDRGRRFDVANITGIMAEPPVPGAAYPVLVPQVDADGNALDGLRSPTLEVPLGTYTGWNVRKAGYGEGDSCDLIGSFIPFFRTQAERLAAGDPRRSLEERYPTHADYVARVTAAAEALVAERLLRPDDAARIVGAASAASVP